MKLQKDPWPLKSTKQPATETSKNDTLAIADKSRTILDSEESDPEEPPIRTIAKKKPTNSVVKKVAPAAGKGKRKRVAEDIEEEDEQNEIVKLLTKSGIEKTADEVDQRAPSVEKPVKKAKKAPAKSKASAAGTTVLEESEESEDSRPVTKKKAPPIAKSKKQLPTAAEEATELHVDLIPRRPKVKPSTLLESASKDSFGSGEVQPNSIQQQKSKGKERTSKKESKSTKLGQTSKVTGEASNSEQIEEHQPVKKKKLKLGGGREGLKWDFGGNTLGIPTTLSPVKKS